MVHASENGAEMIKLKHKTKVIILNHCSASVQSAIAHSTTDKIVVSSLPLMK